MANHAALWLWHEHSVDYMLLTNTDILPNLYLLAMLPPPIQVSNALDNLTPPSPLGGGCETLGSLTQIRYIYVGVPTKGHSWISKSSTFPWVHIHVYFKIKC